MVTQAMFRTTNGRLVPSTQIRQSKGFTWYMSFPPLPALLMVPSALIGGRGGNDVIPTVLVAALILPLLLLVLPLILLPRRLEVNDGGNLRVTQKDKLSYALSNLRVGASGDAVEIAAEVKINPR